MTVSVRLGGRSDHVIGARFHPPRIDLQTTTRLHGRRSRRTLMRGSRRVPFFFFFVFVIHFTCFA